MARNLDRFTICTCNSVTITRTCWKNNQQLTLSCKDKSNIAPVGFKPACKPKGGTKAGSTPLELDAAVADAIGADEATCTAVELAFVTVVAGALEEAATEVAAADEADETADTVDKAVAAEDEPSAPASIALACAEKVVETMGQPTPGPLRFCKVTAAALILASFEALLSSVGKEIPTVGLFKTWPAATFALSSCSKDDY